MTTLKKGDKAPNFSGLDQNGTAHKLADYKGAVDSYSKIKSDYPKTNVARDIDIYIARSQAKAGLSNF